jgi:site-specific recombinase XerD
MSHPVNNRLGARPISDWFPANQGFYVGFRHWLQAGGYGESALRLYAVAARLALGTLDKAYWLIDPRDDLDAVRQAILDTYPNDATRSTYFKGLAKLEEYLRFRCHRPAAEKQVNWVHYLDPLPKMLAEDVRAYVTHCRRTWLPDQVYRSTCTLLSHVTRSLRWAAAENRLAGIEDLTPELWWEYVDYRLAAGITPTTLNGELRDLANFLRFLQEQGRAICRRMLRVEPLAKATHLPRDVPMDRLRRLLAEIEVEAAATHAQHHRMGLLDRTWFLLMLHSGLRTGEVRRLRELDLDLQGGRVRIEQSKGLKDRIVYLSAATVAAIEAYLDVRGPAADDHLLLYRHQPLSVGYCACRLRTYAKRCGVRITPHQLRCSCATLLLNAGAPVLTVQTILGHKFIDTTLGYARLYDGTVAADYYRAIAEVESRFDDGKNESTPPDSGQLLALVDALHAGTLNDAQRETIQALRAGILATFASLSAGLAEENNGSAQPKAS